MGVRLMVDRGTDGLGDDIFAILKRGAPLAAVSLIETSTLAPRRRRSIVVVIHPKPHIPA